jgi:hypothetical protein
VQLRGQSADQGAGCGSRHHRRAEHDPYQCSNHPANGRAFTTASVGRFFNGELTALIFLDDRQLMKSQLFLKLLILDFF